MFAMASTKLAPHISGSGRRRTHTRGRSGFPKIAQRLSGVSCTQRTPAGLPPGMPGMGELIESAMQQAPQPTRQSKAATVAVADPVNRVPGRA